MRCVELRETALYDTQGRVRSMGDRLVAASEAAGGGVTLSASLRIVDTGTPQLVINQEAGAGCPMRAQRGSP